MNDDTIIANAEEIKAAEARGYSKGYAAGKRRKERQRVTERLQREQQSFRRRAFLAALPFALTQNGWQREGKPIQTLEARCSLAWDTADEALKRYW